MPFKSKKQSSACFATGGFGGKVDCEEWANKTNYKKLPKKKHKVKGFKEWLEENHKEDLDENWLGKYVAGPLAMAGGLMGGMSQPSTAQAQPAAVAQQNQEQSLGKDLRQPTAIVQNDQITIKFIPSQTFGKGWNAGKNREVNQDLINKYKILASQMFKVKIGERTNIQQDGKRIAISFQIVK